MHHTTSRRTELLLDDFQDLLLIKLLGEALDGSQGLTTIALWMSELDNGIAILTCELGHSRWIRIWI